jgi:hypothetical protein
MNKILIIYPHFPPSNLAGVHRPRLFAQHLPSFGWDPVILTVHEDYYEEALDWNLHKLIPGGMRIEKVKAYRVTKPRLIGDIGLRAFFQLRKKALELVRKEKIDFVYIPIPSFYVALIGPYLHRKTGVKYGIDYIDPWVHTFPGSQKIFSRHWFSSKIAGLLEPIAVRKVSLITGVAEGYYEPVLERNPYLKTQAVCGGMPYGGEIKDHELLDQLDIKPYLFSRKPGKMLLVYAGAMLPKAFGPLEAVFKSIAANPVQFKSVEFHFIGTGKTPDDPEGFNIKPLARQYGLWETVVYEYPKRIAYLDVLIHLDMADAIFILGSTEPHYTPSKTYQGVLSKKPIMAVLHQKSTAAGILKATRAGLALSFDGENGLNKIRDEFAFLFEEFISFKQAYDPKQVDQPLFNNYSAKAVTAKLVDLLNRVVDKK